MGMKVTGYLADQEESPTGIALHGTVAATTLEHAFAEGQLKVGPYQRERRGDRALLKLVTAIRTNTVLPPIALGMRGSRFASAPGSDDYELADDVYIVDGLQRTYAALAVQQKQPDKPVFLPCVIYFNTTEAWERQYFKLWNTERQDPAASIHLRNAKEEHASVLTLYGLSNSDRACPAFAKVCWDQTPKVGEIMRATTFARIVLILHGKRPSGRSVDNIIFELDRIAEIKGLSHLRNNTRKFFDLIDYCWGLKMLVRRDKALHVREVFLVALAMVMSRSSAFWDDDDRKIFDVNYEVRRKLKTLTIGGELERLVRSSSIGNIEYIADAIVRHINKGKTLRRVVMDGTVEEPAEAPA